MRHAEGIGQDDRRFEEAELFDLGQALSLPKALAT
jgi:hypothetical protein